MRMIFFQSVTQAYSDVYQGQIQKIQKEGAEETGDAVLHHSGSICDQTSRLNVKNFLKIQKKGGRGGGGGPLGPPPKSIYFLFLTIPVSPPLMVKSRLQYFSA